MAEYKFKRGLQLTILIDDEDFHILNEYSLVLVSARNNFTKYVKLNEKKTYKYITTLHRKVMNCPDDMIVDHINGNGLDNRKENLRVCSYSQNAHNRRRNNEQPGVYFENFTGRYRAEIYANCEKFFLGRFDTFEEAAKVRNEAKLKYHKDFAGFGTEGITPWEKQT